MTSTKENIRKLIKNSRLDRAPRKQEPGLRALAGTALLGVPSTPSLASSRSVSVGSNIGDNLLAPSFAGFDNMSQRQGLVEEVRSTTPSPASHAAVLSSMEHDKPVASGNGVSVSINLAEPMLFLQGYDPGDLEERSTSMLRGSLQLRVTKAAKIKTIYLKFRGRAETEWPEGAYWI